MLETQLPHTKVKDYSYQNFQVDDEKDFDVKTIQDEKLIDSIPDMDNEAEFEDSMYNFGEDEDLPDSDRDMKCGALGISRKDCFSR